MSERILIKFKASGDKQLQASMMKLAVTQALLEKNTKKMNAALRRLEAAFLSAGKGSRLLNNSFATLRSKMLLFSFAMSMGGRQLIEFGKQAAKVEAMGTAFTNLAGGGKEATVMITALKKATNGAMSEMDLFKQANNAMILGITKNSDEMAEMFDMAQRLGKALGRDTASSIESLVTGIGRQSRLMLDNIGIIVKSEKAYEKYASKLGITSSELTDTEKKQAFLNATLEAAQDKLKNSGEEVADNQQKFDEFSASMENLGIKLGKVANVALIPLIDALADLADSIDEEAILSYATALGIATSAWALYSAKVAIATASMVKFRKALVRSGIGAAVIALGYLIDESEIFNDTIDDTIDKNLKLAKTTRALTIESMKLNIARMKEGVQIQAINQYSSEYGKNTIRAEHIKEAEKELELFTKFRGTYEEFLESIDKAAALYAKTKDARRESILSQIREIETNQLVFESEEKKIAVLKDLKEQLDKTNTGQEKFFGKLNSSLVEAMNNGDRFAKVFDKMLSDMARSMAANAIVFGIRSILGGPIASLAPTGTFLENVLDIFHQGGQVQGYNTGGLIPQYHSGGNVDNVPIMAQEGEFVMRRSAVESIGLENMNRMNRTGQASGGANITFTGNIMSDSFIEEEAIPKIKDAIRRGADLGIS